MLGEVAVGGARAEALHADHEAASADEAAQGLVAARHDQRAIVGQDRIPVRVALLEEQLDRGR